MMKVVKLSIKKEDELKQTEGKVLKIRLEAFKKIIQTLEEFFQKFGRVRSKTAA